MLSSSTRKLIKSSVEKCLKQQQLVSASTRLINNNNKSSSIKYFSSSSSSLLNNYYSTQKPIQFNLADVGEGIAECEILNWHFKVGDTIKEFDRLCDVQSDKATVEITSRYDGVITKLYHKVGEMAKVGSPLCDIMPVGSEAPSAAPVVETKSSSAPSAAATTSTTTTTTSTHHEENIITNKYGEKISVLATPSVRNLAKINQIDLKLVRGSGKDGRVLKEDVNDYLSGKQQQQKQQPTTKQQVATATTTSTSTTTTTTQSIDGKPRETRVPITGIKKVMVKSMNAAAAVPHFGYCDEYLMDGLMHLRSQLKPLAESRGIKLSYLPFIIKATSLALLRYPVLNSSLSPDETEVIYKNYHNIGVAMDTPNGLLVPNIKNVESKSIYDIAQELNRLHKLGLAGQLSPNDMSGGTFSLSNIGSIGGTYASPVLLLPEVAIGAIGKIQKLPRFDRDNNVYPVNLIQISWSADHRVIDGATMANFSNLLKNYIEQPNSMLFDTK
eukprot:gene2435-3005_t